jgi:hypothetical protein
MRGLTLSACCAVFMVWCLPCSAQTFGELNLRSEVRSLSPERATPSIAKWLLRLPDPADLLMQNAGSDEVDQMLVAEPIGGEIYHLTSFPQSKPPATDLVAAFSSGLLDATPIGGQALHFEMRSGGRARALAEKFPVEGRKPAMEGRSVLKSTGRRPAAGRHARSTIKSRPCVCTRTAAETDPAVGARGQPTYSNESGLATLNRFLGIALFPL